MKMMMKRPAIMVAVLASGETRTRRSAAPRCSPCAPHFWTGSARSGCDRAGDVRTARARSWDILFDEWLARDVLHDRDGTLADERDRHRLGAHAVARDATVAWETCVRVLVSCRCKGRPMQSKPGLSSALHSKCSHYLVLQSVGTSRARRRNS